MFSSIKVEISEADTLVVCTIKGVKIPFSPNGKVEEKFVPIFREGKEIKIGDAYIRVANFAEGYAILDFDIYRAGWNALLEDASDSGMLICRRYFAGSVTPHLSYVQLLSTGGNRVYKDNLLPMHLIASKVREFNRSSEEFRGRKSWRDRTHSPEEPKKDKGYSTITLSELKKIISEIVAEAMDSYKRGE